MTKQEMVNHLNSDLCNEYTHMLFYLQSAACVIGPHRLKYQEFLGAQAASEMEHVRQFSDMIVGLDGVPEVSFKPFPTLTTPEQIIDYAVKLEGEVLENYLRRMEMADSLECGVDRMAVQLFMEEQFQHSREDYDNMRQIIPRV